MKTDKGKQTYSEETGVKSQRLNASVLVQPKDTVSDCVRVIHILTGMDLPVLSEL
jgi:hypothetical protein